MHFFNEFGHFAFEWARKMLVHGFAQEGSPVGPLNSLSPEFEFFDFIFEVEHKLHDFLFDLVEEVAALCDAGLHGPLLAL